MVWSQPVCLDTEPTVTRNSSDGQLSWPGTSTGTKNNLLKWSIFNGYYYSYNQWPLCCDLLHFATPLHKNFKQIMDFTTFVLSCHKKRRGNIDVVNLHVWAEWGWRRVRKARWCSRAEWNWWDRARTTTWGSAWQSGAAQGWFRLRNCRRWYLQRRSRCVLLTSITNSSLRQTGRRQLHWQWHPAPAYHDNGELDYFTAGKLLADVR